MGISFSVIQKLMEQSDIKHQIHKHSDLTKFGRIHHTIVAKSHDDDVPDIMTIDEFVDQCVDEHTTWIGEIKSAVAAAVRSGGFVTNQFITFSDTALLQLRELAGLAKTLNDDYFIISFAEQTSATTGLIQFVFPVISVIDISEEVPVNVIQYEDNHFVLKHVCYDIFYSAYDIIDMLSIGNQVSLKKTTETKYAPLAELRRVFLEAVYDYQCLEYAPRLRVDPKIDAHDIEQLLLEVNDKLSKQEIFTCKICGKHYTISEDERKWYAEKNFKLPKKCSSCRESIRQEKRQKENAEWLSSYYHDLGYGDEF